ncbi:DUF4363 family protein [Feifania hominis]|uniref:DUF4363 family protein n=1 Tax=Feifania hominis TaxID=2763660 RepID=A0A926HUJ1_9FIRM|nr:DUF4363 family protein [Feifania hominis]MBC8535611.1 DUF4363 family protein [Feifania hominis]
MKSIVIAILCLAIIICGAGFCYYLLQERSHDMILAVERVEQSLQDGSTQQAREEMEQMLRQFESYEHFITMVMNHEEVDQIKNYVERANGFMKVGRYDEFQVELAVIKMQLDHMHEVEMLNWRNIF